MISAIGLYFTNRFLRICWSSRVRATWMGLSVPAGTRLPLCILHLPMAACWDWTAVLCPRMADECLDEIEALASEATATRALVADMAVALRELLPSYCDPRSPVYPTHAAAEALIAKANAMVEASTRAE